MFCLETVDRVVGTITHQDLGAMTICLIGCGSNLGQRREQLDQAIELLRYMPGVCVTAVSRYHETRPIGGPLGQEPFLNSAAVLETDLEPAELFSLLEAVENTLHRERNVRWGPRTVDLDMLLYGDVVLETEALTLPHPRMVTRRFVLEPCVEIAGGLRHPTSGFTLAELLDAISSPHSHVAVVGVPGSGAPEVAEIVADITLARLLRAPISLPLVVPSVHDCSQLISKWSEAMMLDEWPDDPHGTVSDFWLGLPLATARRHLTVQDITLVERQLADVGPFVRPPQVILFLESTRSVIVKRLCECDRESEESIMLELDAIMDLQSSLSHAFRKPGHGAVVCINADDLEQAAIDAVAAVEAMA